MRELLGDFDPHLNTTTVGRMKQVTMPPPVRVPARRGGRGGAVLNGVCSRAAASRSPLAACFNGVAAAARYDGIRNYQSCLAVEWGLGWRVAGVRWEGAGWLAAIQAHAVPVQSSWVYFALSVHTGAEKATSF